jgi:hypothetical protein
MKGLTAALEAERIGAEARVSSEVRVTKRARTTRNPRLAGKSTRETGHHDEGFTRSFPIEKLLD